MSQTVTGTQAPAAIGRIDGNTKYASQDFVVASGITVNAGDFVYFSSGTITNATVEGARLIGMVEGGSVNPIVGTATGTVTATVCVDPLMRYLIETDGAIASVSNGVSSDVGQYYNLLGTTGAQQIDHDQQSTTLGQFLLLTVPGQTGFPAIGLQGLTANRYGIYLLVNSFLNPYVAAS